MHQRQTDEVLRMLSPTLRPDCPKGTSCQDAIVDYRHATHFNHICLPTISQPLQAPSDGTGEGGRVIMKTTVEVKTFRAGFLPDQVTFRDRDGQPSFIVTCYDSDGVAATPGKATLWDWEWLNNARNQIRPHFDVYYTMKGYEYRWRGKFGMLNETESMEWVRCQHGRIPDGRTPVIGGKTKEGTTLHHAAVWWQTRRIPGKVNPDLGRAIIGFNGREIKVTGGYDVLCWK
ncbi:hypothetical protein CALCODRAFT_496203 [Calocera cornea HHB12733]|uniref:Uncharacterized protein n=1 Tax=Calocera cornea HHB12733 TaxID=1353952 RepID=A0A165FZC5_9BASI|nr:hypothetical protein CALCODRAFT_496203 [Calocera cornea HHB12733]